jgi:flagellar basal-body rod protein FlgB
MSMIDDPMIANLSRFLDVNVFRTGLIMSNLANIDTPGYHTQDLNFQQELDREQAADGNGDLTLAGFAPGVRRVRGLPSRPDGNDVSLERETLLLATTQMRFNAAVQLLRDQFKTISAAIHEGGLSS